MVRKGAGCSAALTPARGPSTALLSCAAAADQLVDYKLGAVSCGGGQGATSGEKAWLRPLDLISSGSKGGGKSMRAEEGRLGEAGGAPYLRWPEKSLDIQVSFLLGMWGGEP